jgi:DNA mismatch repair protein MutL
MPDIIKLLPDAVANQIAAGEVIQRPSSAVKELMENAVDAGASDIQLIIKDAGRTLIQVIDNGCGMSVTDARMSFERHATSKINEAKDLFAIKTLGFRGEALASIAAIAQVELKSKRNEDELGTQILIEGSKVVKQTPCTTANGTSIAVKNLFFNVPARRNFLKSNTAELRHITDEFLRVALVNKDIAFSLTANNKPLYQLKASGLKERIVAIHGSNYKERLVPVEQNSSIANISGFIGKPEFARKTRGEQYFFVNGRYIRHAYLHHSIDQAYQEVLPADTYPSYFLFIDTDPDRIDINIHPTKTEVNFQDQQHIYAILKSAVRQALGKFNLSPAIDFDVEQSIDFRPPGKDQAIKNPFEKSPTDYNPFEDQELPPGKRPLSEREQINRDNWEMLFDAPQGEKKHDIDDQQEFAQADQEQLTAGIFQFAKRYIVTSTSSGIILIDQYRAHERILYDRFMKQLESGKSASQQELFPQQISLPLSDAEILRDIKPELETLGFTINDLGKNTFVITGIPAIPVNKDINELLEKILENYKQNMLELDEDIKINLASSLASNFAMRSDKALDTREMEALISQLFSSTMPEISPGGKKIIREIGREDIDKLFKS